MLSRKSYAIARGLGLSNPLHVIAKYGCEVIDRVGVDETDRQRADNRALKLIKGARWLLLRNRDHITANCDWNRLHLFLYANAALANVYILKDDLKQLW